MYEDLLADYLTCLALLTAFVLFGELVRAYILYDLNKRVSHRNPAGNDSADKLQWHYYLAGFCHKIEANSAATIASTRSLEARGCLYWSIDRRAVVFISSLSTGIYAVYTKRMLQFRSRFIMTGVTKPMEKCRLLAFDTAHYKHHNKKERRSFESSSQRNPSTSLILHSSQNLLVLLPAKARVLTNAFGETKAVLALAAMRPVLMMMLLQLILCEAS